MASASHVDVGASLLDRAQSVPPNNNVQAQHTKPESSTRAEAPATTPGGQPTPCSQRKQSSGAATITLDSDEDEDGSDAEVHDDMESAAPTSPQRPRRLSDKIRDKLPLRPVSLDECHDVGDTPDASALHVNNKPENVSPPPPLSDGSERAATSAMDTPHNSVGLPPLAPDTMMHPDYRRRPSSSHTPNFISIFAHDRERQSRVDRGIRYFNLNPKKGIRYLQNAGVIEYKDTDPLGNANAIANFLRSTRGLNKEQIGVVLGMDDDQSLAVLREYVALHNFAEFGATVQGIETGLRKLLAYFKPPGEAQKIDRILVAFADKFSLDNHMAGQDTQVAAEATYMVAFITILLNVDLHNPNNPRRMLRKEFVRNCGQIEELKDIPELELKQLYDRVTKSEIKHKVDREDLSGNLFTNPDKCGWLMKKGPNSWSRWKYRWFILSANTLYYFRDSEDTDFLGFIPLENVMIRTASSFECQNNSISTGSTCSTDHHIDDASFTHRFNNNHHHHHASGAPPSCPHQTHQPGCPQYSVCTSEACRQFLAAHQERRVSLDSTTDHVQSVHESEYEEPAHDCIATGNPQDTTQLADSEVYHNHEGWIDGALSPSGDHVSQQPATHQHSYGNLTPNHNNNNAISTPKTKVMDDEHGNLHKTVSEPQLNPAASNVIKSPNRRFSRSYSIKLLRRVQDQFKGEIGTDSSFEGLRPFDDAGRSFGALHRSSGCIPGLLSRHFWFELRPWDRRLKVKSARTIKNGSLVLGQHRTIKLRTDSRQDLEDWVRVLNQKGMLHSQTLEELSARTRIRGNSKYKTRYSISGIPISLKQQLQTHIQNVPGRSSTNANQSARPKSLPVSLGANAQLCTCHVLNAIDQASSPMFGKIDEERLNLA